MKKFQVDAIKRIDMEAKAAKQKLLMLEHTDWDYADIQFNVVMCKTRRYEGYVSSTRQDLGCCV
ncbi:MAG: hypothetical protein WC236_13710 [Gallionellaceae bacterium]|jgi:hypothetical protein